jgi:hypothetical protein
LVRKKGWKLVAKDKQWAVQWVAMWVLSMVLKLVYSSVDGSEEKLVVYLAEQKVERKALLMGVKRVEKMACSMAT